MRTTWIPEPEIIDPTPEEEREWDRTHDYVNGQWVEKGGVDELPEV